MKKYLLLLLLLLSFSPVYAGTRETELIKITNEYRVANKLPALKENSKLMEVARLRAEEINRTGIFSHQGKRNYIILAIEQKYKYRFLGENLAIYFTDNNAAFNAWLNSPSHKNNIINPKYREIGVASSGNLYVQIFGRI